MTERPECNEQHPGVKHVHHCWRGDGHYDDHLCECGFDWRPGAERSIAEAGQPNATSNGIARFASKVTHRA